MMIKAVSFDIGGTLVSFPGAHSLRTVLSHHFRVDKSLFQRAYTDHFIKHATTKRHFCELVCCESEVELDRILLDYYSNKLPGCLFGDVIYALTELKALGLSLLTISNKAYCNPSTLVDYGIASYFDAEIYSCDFGYAKPERGIFSLAAQSVNIDPHEIVHVGDSVKSDVFGAHSAGYKAILLQSGIPWNVKRNGAVHYSICGNLTQAVKVIERFL